MRCAHIVPLFACLAALGCEQATIDSVKRGEAARMESPAPGVFGGQAPAETESLTLRRGGGGGGVRLKQSSGEVAYAPEARDQAGKPLTRKIKHTADIALVVEEFDKAASAVSSLVQAQGGYVAQSEVLGSAGMPRSGRWRVRVPADRLDAFVDAVAKLGVPERRTTDSEDVTARYVDLDARLKNKKAQEETLRGYLQEKKATAQLKDILTVEQELARVRGEIEQMEGELRLLTNLTDLATATVSVREVKNYVPPETPKFSTDVTRMFARSLEALQNLGKFVVLLAVAVAPWLPLGGLIALAVSVPLVRARRRRAVVPTTHA